MLLTGRAQRRQARRCQRVSALLSDCGAAEAPCFGLRGVCAQPLAGSGSSIRFIHFLVSLRWLLPYLELKYAVCRSRHSKN
jgi:hypothetical protein